MNRNQDTTKVLFIHSVWNNNLERAEVVKKIPLNKKIVRF